LREGRPFKRMRASIAANKPYIEAFSTGIFLIVLLELYYIVTAKSSTLQEAVLDILLSAAVLLILASFYFRKNLATERALRESESRFDTVVENALEWIWEIDIEGRYTYASPVVETILGYKPKELMGKSFFELAHPDDIGELAEKVREVLEERSSFRNFLKRNINRKGEVVWLSTSGVPIIDEEGGLKGYRGVSQDITERVHYEQKLEALNKHAAELANAETMSHVAHSTLSAIEQILGYDYLAFGEVEEDLLKFRNTRGREEIQALPLNGRGISVRAVKTGETQLVPDVREDSDFIPSQIPQESISELDVPVKVNGEVVAVINLESEQRNAFSLWDAKLVEILAHHVSSAITIIHEKERYKTSCRELELSNRELDNYTYAVSHDLKAPLRTIQAFTHLLLQRYSEHLDEEGRDYMNRVVNASKRMQELVDDLLVLSRVGRKYTEETHVDLNKLMDEIKLDLEATIKEKEAEILCDNLPTIKAQKVWIHQLFTNLIDNGLKFNDSPSPRVWVAYEERWADYVFSVKDNGIGISEKDKGKIFDVFQRLHTQEEYPGTGAGLAICKKVVESYGGRIWVESHLGSGSIFYFTYPKDVGEKEGTLSDHESHQRMQTENQIPEVVMG
jgi:PAS domain S-box-containing protein